jgi:hypothetical protein
MLRAMPSLGRTPRSRRARASACALLCAVFGAVAVRGQELGPQPEPTPAAREVGGIRVEGGTFWYDCLTPAVSPGTGTGGTCAARVVAALERVLREYPERFLRPLPVATVIRAVPREHVDTTPLWSGALGSYGCATLERGVVVIEIGPQAFAGRDALNDAELRSLVAHELLHAYQFGRGCHDGRPEEIARRELEALDWELAHLEPGVRAHYRDDLDFNRRMFAAMLEGAEPR